MATPTYKIEYQAQTVGLGPDGRPTEGWKVGYFIPDLNIHGSVFIPQVQFNANKAKAAIAEQIAHHEAVHKLGGA